ncbi:SMI1/KNR4 family protein [Gemmata sp.]|uniref:SMI1/KNR4 family protein n=1 Tax=Gemmata sp. TaxID=1914242 RepID=UPI003F70EBC4
MDDARYDQLLRRMERSGVATPEQLVGCCASEIAALEATYSLKLPRSYRRYLEVMGHSSGKLFTHDHMAVTYPYVLEMTREEHQRWARWREERGRHTAPPPEFEFPADGLLIAGRLGEQFNFIRCSGQEDAPVWYLHNYRWQMRETDASVLGWLEGWCKEAEDAIASGYFYYAPEGTTP